MQRRIEAFCEGALAMVEAAQAMLERGEVAANMRIQLIKTRDKISKAQTIGERCTGDSLSDDDERVLRECVAAILTAATKLRDNAAH